MLVGKLCVYLLRVYPSTVKTRRSVLLGHLALDWTVDLTASSHRLAIAQGEYMG
jgi:hypothetical protein